MKKKCDCIVGFDIEFSLCSDGVWVATHTERFTKKDVYNNLQIKCKYCPKCGKRIKEQK